MQDRRTLILNFKNYAEVLGAKSLELARAAERVSSVVDIDIVLAPPTPMIGAVASAVNNRVFSQKAEVGEVGQSTGALIPESIKAAGAAGTILNHSEARVTPAGLNTAIPRLKSVGLEVCLCGRTPREVSKLAALSTEYLALEPPELIGSGVAVSKARPELIEDVVRVARSEAYHGRILCGAGIVSGDDVRMAVKLGVDGLLVSSSVVKAKNWDGKITELALALQASRNP